MSSCPGYPVCFREPREEQISMFISELPLKYLSDFVQLLSSLGKSLSISAIHHVDNGMSVGEIHLPILSELFWFYLIEFCPPRSHTWNLRFLYSTTSILNPIVGTVCFTSFKCNLSELVNLYWGWWSYQNCPTQLLLFSVPFCLWALKIQLQRWTPLLHTKIIIYKI